MTLSNDTVVVVLARMGSRRLPGKVLMRVGSHTLLGHVITRLASLHRPIVVATTERAEDDEVASHCLDLGVSVYRGSMEDVVARSVEAADSLSGEWFVRVNADSPFPDPELISLAGRHQRGEVDLVTNIPGRTFPYGVSVEVVRVESLRRMLGSLTHLEQEHVTAVFYRDLSRFNVVELTSKHTELRAARLTVDTPADLKEMRRLVDSLGDSTKAGWARIAKRSLELRKSTC